VLEVLREPLENGVVSISRAARQVEFPSRFQLIAAMNPCPCGYLNDPSGRCRCTNDQVQRYRSRISGPLLDRLDLHVEVPRIDPECFRTREADGETSGEVAARVHRARELQHARQGCCNARLNNAGIDRHCLPTREGQALLERAMQRFGLSARAYHRILKVGRTIADLAGEQHIGTQHVSEAITLRQLDKPARSK
jgi:magnesium chelatase family protein